MRRPSLDTQARTLCYRRTMTRTPLFTVFVLSCVSCAATPSSAPKAGRAGAEVGVEAAVPSGDSARPASPGFFADCSLDEAHDDNGPVLGIVCGLRLVIVSNAPGPVDADSAAKKLAQFEALFVPEASINRKTVLIDGKTCWKSAVKVPGWSWSHLLIVPVGPQSTRLVHCTDQTATETSPWCERAIWIVAKGGAPKELLQTP